MNIRLLYLALCSATAALRFTSGVQAQVFIPNTDERDWLNAEIPGIVDASGIMDTLHPGIQELDTAIMALFSLPASVELRGVAYLDALTSFSLFTDGQMPPPSAPSTVTLVGVPQALRTLVCGVASEQGVDLVLPQLPAEMDLLRVENYFGTTRLDIVGLPDHVTTMVLNMIDELSWQGECDADRLYLGGQGVVPSGELYVPPIRTEFLEILDMTITLLDLSLVSTPEVYMWGSWLPGVVHWPVQLERLDIFNSTCSNGLSTLPSTLEVLSLDLTYMPCLPFLPAGLSQLTMVPSASVTCLPNWPPALLMYSTQLGDFTEATATYCSVLNSECPGGYPAIAGRVFADIDGNGQYNVGEPGLPQTQVTLQPNGQVTGCGVDGTWEIGVLPGAYTIAAASTYPYIQSIAPATHTASVPNMGDTDLGNDFAVTLTPDMQDLRVSLYADPARPGFDNRVYLSCQNYGTTVVDAELTLSHDGDQTWVGSSIAPSSTTGTTATWSLSAMAIGSTAMITVDLNTAASVALGTAIVHTLSADPIATDETPTDNTTQFTDSVVGSYDPNDKLLQPAVLSPEQVQAQDKPIEYTIRFQNTGTYLAERVVIVDTLSADLQWTTMQFIASSHASQWYITEGVLHMIHNDIMLPDSTSDEANSHGFVKFSMLPANDLQDGAEVVNIAHIVFDFNAPIITPPAIFRVDVEAGLEERTATTLSVFPNPAKDLLHVGAPMTTRGVITYAVHDILGKQLLQGTLGHAAQIAVGDLANGVYNLTIHGGGQRDVVQFVKE